MNIKAILHKSSAPRYPKLETDPDTWVDNWWRDYLTTDNCSTVSPILRAIFMGEYKFIAYGKEQIALEMAITYNHAVSSDEEMHIGILLRQIYKQIKKDVESELVEIPVMNTESEKSNYISLLYGD